MTSCKNSPPPKISNDTKITAKTEISYKYECDDGQFDFPTLNYPTTINAFCRPNEIMNKTLPFWKVDNLDVLEKFPKNESLCRHKELCPADPPKVHQTWNQKK